MKKEQKRAIIVGERGVFFPRWWYFMIGRDVPRWLKRLDFSSCTDEADKRRHENASSGS